MRLSTLLSLVALISMGYISAVQNETVIHQRHTIREYLGLEHGRFEGPELKKKPLVPSPYIITEN